MKFIVDAQLPKRLCELLMQLGADCVHTLDLPHKNKITDHFILDYANAENRIVVTKDRDFLQSYLLLKQPKKLLLVNTGNIPNNLLLQLFQQNYALISDSFINKDLITINSSEIIIHQ